MWCNQSGSSDGDDDDDEEEEDNGSDDEEEEDDDDEDDDDEDDDDEEEEEEVEEEEDEESDDDSQEDYEHETKRRRVSTPSPAPPAITKKIAPTLLSVAASKANSSGATPAKATLPAKGTPAKLNVDNKTPAKAAPSVAISAPLSTGAKRAADQSSEKKPKTPAGTSAYCPPATPGKATQAVTPGAGGFSCPTCKKSFKNEVALKMHRDSTKH